MIAITSEMFKMVYDWVLTEDSFQYLCDGGIKQGEDTYMCIKVLGYEEDNKSYLVIDGVKYDKWNVVAKCNDRKAYLINGDNVVDIGKFFNINQVRDWNQLFYVPQIPNKFKL